LSKTGKPVDKPKPTREPRPPRQPGGWEGQVRIAEDFDAPLPPDVQSGFNGNGGHGDGVTSPKEHRRIEPSRSSAGTPQP
jgi:hypothetical protein